MTLMRELIAFMPGELESNTHCLEQWWENEKHIILYALQEESAV